MDHRSLQTAWGGRGTMTKRTPMFAFTVALAVGFDPNQATRRNVARRPDHDHLDLNQSYVIPAPTQPSWLRTEARST